MDQFKEIRDILAGIEKKLDALAKDFRAHYEWHKRQQENIRKASENFHESLGIRYAVAHSRKEAHKGSFCAGPTPDLTALQASADGCVLVMFQPDGPEPTTQIVMEYVEDEWVDVKPPEVLVTTVSGKGPF